MKKIILVALAAIVSTGAFAQKFEWGVKAGLNLAKITDAEDTKFRTGVAAGVFGEYVINDLFGVQAELLYSMQGAKPGDDIELGVDDAVMKLDYINLPILAKFYVLEGLSVEVGPQFSFLASSKLKGKSEGVSAEVDMDDIEGIEMNKFDIGAAMGLSYKFNFGLDVFARYNLGFIEIAKDADSKNGVISVGVGYRF